MDEAVPLGFKLDTLINSDISRSKHPKTSNKAHAVIHVKAFVGWPQTNFRHYDYICALDYVTHPWALKVQSAIVEKKEKC